MRNLVVLLALAVFISIPRPDPVLAGPNANAKILIHLIPAPAKNRCTRSDATPPCSGILTSGDLYPAKYIAYVLVTDADSAAGIAGVQFGVTYNDSLGAGVDIESWTNCAKLQFAMDGWPASGTGNLITWDRTTQCQRFEPGGSGTGVMAVAGYFYCTAYGPDTLRVIPRPVDGEAKVANCAAEEDTVESQYSRHVPSHLGLVVFTAGALDPGYSPCGQLADSLLAVWTMDVSWDSTVAASVSLARIPSKPARGAVRLSSTDLFPVSTLIVSRCELVPLHDHSYRWDAAAKVISVDPDGSIRQDNIPTVPRTAVASLPDGRFVTRGKYLSGLPGQIVWNLPSSEETVELSPGHPQQSLSQSLMDPAPSGEYGILTTPGKTILFDSARGIVRSISFESSRVSYASSDLLAMWLFDRAAMRQQLQVLRRDGTTVYEGSWVDNPTPSAWAFLFPDGQHLYYPTRTSARGGTGVLDVATGVAQDLASLPDWRRRAFSRDGRSMVLLSRVPEQLAFYSIDDPTQPVLLWEYALPTNRIVTALELSACGSYIAYQLQRDDSSVRDLYVLDKQGALWGRALHDNEPNSHGLAFVSDSELFEGLNLRNPCTTTERVNLYRLPQVQSCSAGK